MRKIIEKNEIYTIFEDNMIYEGKNYPIIIVEDEVRNQGVVFDKDNKKDNEKMNKHIESIKRLQNAKDMNVIKIESDKDFDDFLFHFKWNFVNREFNNPSIKEKILVLEKKNSSCGEPCEKLTSQFEKFCLENDEIACGEINIDEYKPNLTRFKYFNKEFKNGIKDIGENNDNIPSLILFRDDPENIINGEDYSIMNRRIAIINKNEKNMFDKLKKLIDKFVIYKNNK